MEYREGITRCPEHDVDLVDGPPEAEEERAAWIDRLSARDLPGVAAIVVAVAGVVYGITGVALSAWSTLAQKRDWIPTTPIEAVQFLQSAAWAIGLGALGCLGAAILAWVYVRLTQSPPDPAAADEAEDDEEYEPEAPSGAWFMPLLSTLVVCFAVAWAAVSIWIAWETATAGVDPFGFTPVAVDADDLLSDLFAFQSAAFAGLAGSFAAMGALLMARAHDRLSGVA